MTIQEHLAERNITKYRLSKESGVPYSTVQDICSGKARIEKCSVEVLYRIAKALEVPMEELVETAVEKRCVFDIFKSNVCHRVKDMGDLDFIIELLESNEIRCLYDKCWYLESLYLLAMLDYLSRENELPLCIDYDDIRAQKLQRPIYPASVIIASYAAKSDGPRKKSWDNAIPEFRRFNIVEGEVRNVL
ncbi:MAG: helix-turn-helix transcriptional regulator [Clostridiales bacterium]|nr:helix-turn-helix transcriptional regulator [Clostridiales bacterium]